MEKLRVFSGKKLRGKIDIISSKNALLPMLAGSLLAGGDVVFEDVPNLIDISKMCSILQSLGAKTQKTGNLLCISTQNADKYLIGNELGKDLRGSVIFLGALLSKFRHAVVCYPGGCNIGSRPIDLHLKGLRALGVEIVEKHGYLYCNGDNMKPATFAFEKQSVGATENLILASVMLDGTTTLKNCAKEPEIVDFANFLNSMGACVKGAGTSEIVIVGKKHLHATKYRAIGDRIVAGTYMVATAMAGGDVEICNINPNHLLNVSKKLAFCGCNVRAKNDRIFVSANGRCKALKSITTGVFPKFPTDLQSAFLSLMTVSKGKCKIFERIFDGRFKQVPYLIKMGAKIDVVCNCAIVEGVQKLSGADVTATDLRAGAGLVLCGLVADGYTTIDNVHLIDRGYDHIERDLQMLGADIERLV